MLQPTQRQRTQRPPNKIAGIVYVLIGFMALGVSAFVLLYQKTVDGPTSNTWFGFGIVIALYGLFRVYTGVSTIRRAAKWNDSINPNSESELPKPPNP
jgi:protein-S-isoprenylcysteine O-methyltransferase Ste14